MSPEDDLVERYGITPAIEPLVESDRPGRIDSPEIVEEIDRAQRVVEGQSFEIRRMLWNYSSTVEQQRRILGTRREQALQEPSSLKLLARLRPEC